jgi:hypothetical protein
LSLFPSEHLTSWPVSPHPRTRRRIFDELLKAEALVREFQTKDDLIVRLLRAEEALKAARNVENRLREEIIRLHVAHGPRQF